jgi:ribosome biogenesis GTPase
MSEVRGLVVRAQSRRFTVWTEGRFVDALVPKRLRFENPDLVDPVAVGDTVRMSLRDDQGLILSVDPRRNALGREALGQAKRQVLAANVDLAVIVLSVAEPSWKPATLDRYLVLASASGISALICLNKADLDPSAALDPALDVYRRLKIPVSVVSVTNGTGMDGLRILIAGKTVVLLGPSGAGKSSLMNRLVPGAEVRVGSVSVATGKGKHTTTWVEMHELPGGGRLIDSPGLRALDLTGVLARDLALHFPEIESLAGPCRFLDCVHVAEPDCAVKRAVESGAMAPHRYESYRKIFESLGRGAG